MELWVPSLITGVFALAAAFGGYALSGHREKQHRAEDQDRADKNSQRQAVAAFLRADRTLSGQLQVEMNEIEPRPVLQTLRPEKADALISLRSLYFNDLLQELEVLDLQLHDPHVRKAFNRVDKIIRRKYKQFLLELRRIYEMNPPQQDRTFKRLVTDGIATDDLRAARQELIEVARDRLRLKLAINEMPGMYTPFDG